MSWVYFIKPDGMPGPIKIGVSKSPERRRVQLENSSPVRLKIVALVIGGGLLERRFHAHFEHLHERCEWFRFAPELQEMINRINCGKFDASQLPAGLRIDGRGIPRPAYFGLQMSYSARVWRTEDKTGMKCPVDIRDMVKRDDRGRMAVVDAYLSDPFAHGIAHRVAPARDGASGNPASPSAGGVKISHPFNIDR